MWKMRRDNHKPDSSYNSEYTRPASRILGFEFHSGRNIPNRHIWLLADTDEDELYLRMENNKKE